MSGPRRIEVVGDEDVREDAEHAVRRRDYLVCGDRALHRRTAVANARVRDDDLEGSVSVPARIRCESEGVIHVLDEHALRERSEHCGDRCLVAGTHLHRITHEPAHAGAAALCDLRGVAGDRECAGERGCLRCQRLRLAFRCMQSLPDALLLRLHGDDLCLSTLIRLGMFGGGALRRFAVFDELAGLRGLAASRVGSLESVLLSQHGAAHRRKSGCCGVCRSSQGVDAHVVRRDEGALLRDVDVERIELRASPLHLACRVLRRILGVAESR